MNTTLKMKRAIRIMRTCNHLWRYNNKYKNHRCFKFTYVAFAWSNPKTDHQREFNRLKKELTRAGIEYRVGRSGCHNLPSFWIDSPLDFTIKRA